jgi:hypothetical protein
MKSALQIRKEMTLEGWASEDRMTDMGWGCDGKYGYSIWFERWNWHGKSTTKVCFHSSTSDLDAITDCVERGAELARRAWKEFPDSVPRQDLGSKLVVDELMTSWWVKARSIEEQRQMSAERQAERKDGNKLYASYKGVDLLELTSNQICDIKEIRESKYCDKLHACYFQSDPDEIEELVQLGVLEYVDSFRYGKLMLKCTSYGRRIEMQRK